MLARATARAAARAARAAPRRSVNLSALEAKVTSDEGKQELNRLKMALNEAELLKQKYSSAPAAIDFASYKGKVDASLLALAEKEFKGVQYPPFAELDEAKATTVTRAIIFLSTRHQWNRDLLDRNGPAGTWDGWRVPETELFETVQVMRRRLVTWLRAAPQAALDSVMDSILRAHV